MLPEQNFLVVDLSNGISFAALEEASTVTNDDNVTVADDINIGDDDDNANPCPSANNKNPFLIKKIEKFSPLGLLPLSLSLAFSLSLSFSFSLSLSCSLALSISSSLSLSLSISLSLSL